MRRIADEICAEIPGVRVAVVHRTGALSVGDIAVVCAASAPHRAEAYEASHFDDDVQKALDALLPEFRAAVVLADIEGLTYEEISATLGVKLGTVRSRIHRGRTQLRKALAHRAPDERSRGRRS